VVVLSDFDVDLNSKDELPVVARLDELALLVLAVEDLRGKPSGQEQGITYLDVRFLLLPVRGTELQALAPQDGDLVRVESLPPAPAGVAVAPRTDPEEPHVREVLEVARLDHLIDLHVTMEGHG
jgi:hypothetical protein